MFIRANEDDAARIEETKNRFFMILAKMRKEAVGGTPGDGRRIYEETDVLPEAGALRGRGQRPSAPTRSRNDGDYSQNPAEIIGSPSPNKGVGMTKVTPSGGGADGSSEGMPGHGGGDPVVDPQIPPAAAGDETGATKGYATETIPKIKVDEQGVTRQNAGMPNQTTTVDQTGAPVGEQGGWENSVESFKERHPGRAKGADEAINRINKPKSPFTGLGKGTKGGGGPAISKGNNSGKRGR